MQNSVDPFSLFPGETMQPAESVYVVTSDEEDECLTYTVTEPSLVDFSVVSLFLIRINLKLLLPK